jgi:hypothetical protein
MTTYTNTSSSVNEPLPAQEHYEELVNWLQAINRWSLHAANIAQRLPALAAKYNFWIASPQENAAIWKNWLLA